MQIQPSFQMMKMSNQNNDRKNIQFDQDKTRTRELLRLLIDDDHAAWCELVNSYGGLLFGLARNIFERHGRHASRHDIEDAVTAVWRNLLDDERSLLRKCLDRGEILPLLHTLVRNRCIDMMRKMGSDPCVPFAAEFLEKIPAPQEENEEEIPSGRQIVLAMDSLAAKERTCIKLFYLQERGYREISEITGIPMNSIGPTIRRALDKLRTFLSK